MNSRRLIDRIASDPELERLAGYRIGWDQSAVDQLFCEASQEAILRMPFALIADKRHGWLPQLTPGCSADVRSGGA